MAARFIRHHILDTKWVPHWLTGPNRGRFMWAVGTALDVVVQQAQDGVLQRFPLFCTEEALTWIGRDRGIRRGFAESSESYRARLVRWRSIRRRAGTAWGVLENVQSYFLPQVPVVRLVTGGTTAAQWWTLGSDGSFSFVRRTPSNWDWDSADPNTATIDTQRPFHIIIYQDPSDPLSLFPPLGTTASQDPTRTRGTSGLALAAGDLLRLATERKQGGTWCRGVIIAHDLSLFSPTGSGANYPNGTWYRYSDPATYLPVRARDARYFSDRRRPGLFQEGLTDDYTYP